MVKSIVNNNLLLFTIDLAAETNRETKNAMHEEQVSILWQDQPVCALLLDVWASSDTRGRAVATASCPVPLELRNNGELL